MFFALGSVGQAGRCSCGPVAKVMGRNMTETEFVSRFQREPTGSWTCTKPLKIDSPNGPLFITQGQSFSPGALFLGIELAKELDRMAAI